MYIALADDLSRAVWRDGGHRFAGLAATLRARGHEVALLDAANCEPARIVTGCARERDGGPLIASTRLACVLRAAPADVCLFPADEGLAHATLMARACGEFSIDTRVVLFVSPSPPLSARTPFHEADGLRSITAGAMRRFCAGAADQMIETPLPSELTLLVQPLSGAVREISFCGPFSRGHGFVTFVEAVELLDRLGRLDGRTINFIGYFAAGGAIDREWLGRRASGWTFSFRVRETCTLAESLPLALGAARLAMVVRADPALVARMVPKARSRSLPVSVTFDAKALAECFEGRDVVDEHAFSHDIIVERLLTVPAPALPRDGAAVGLSVCILHHERPALLGHALDSVLQATPVGEPASPLARLEVVVLDNASRSPAALSALAAAAARPNVRVVSLAEASPYSSALNVAASHATQEFLVFLDDDNLIAPGGLVRLAKACAGGAFDIVTSTLELFDAEPDRPVGLAAFIGPAHTAGLFFNAFGDTSMAFHRDSFLSIGGFLKRAGPYPSADWILLCRAQAAGLRIGVLQQPAFRYRRNTRKAAEHWQPWDREMVRALLLEHYGDAFDAREVAAAAQAMALAWGV